VADNSLTSAQAFLYDLRGPMQANYAKDHVLLAEFSGVGSTDPSFGRITPASSGQIERDNREVFSGQQVRFPLDLNMLQAGGFVSETGTVNVPIAASTTKATAKLVDVVQPTSITLDLQQDSMDTSAVEALAWLVKKTREALAEIVNDAMNTTNGTSGLALADSSQASAGGLVLKVKAGTDFDKLYPGKVVDVLTSSNGADPGQGKRRLIASIQETASPPTVTFDTNQQASDGGSGNITLSNAVGVFIAGSYGNQMVGIEDAANISGSDTFQNVARATYPQFKSTDGRAGTTTTAPLSDAMLDAGILLGSRNGYSNWDFGIGDPSAINVYKNGKLATVRVQPDVKVLPSGFSGVAYQGTGKDIPLIPERKHGTGMVKLIVRDTARIYGQQKGPFFEDSTGAIFQRFSRALPREIWLVDRLQWCWTAPQSIVRYDNLATS
jgi:hypothetical protein